MLPTSLAWLFVILLALIFGSFLNVCISRLPQHRSIVHPGSHCPRCQAPIRPGDNVPVLSWLLLRGRCRGCGLPISIRYPLVEGVYTGLAAACLARFGFTVDGTAAAAFCFLALGLLVMDLETMLLPDSFTLPGLALGFFWASAAGALQASRLGPGGVATLEAAAVSAVDAVVAVAAWAALLLAIRWSYYAVRRRHGLGMGDVKAVAMLAAWLGFSRTALCFMIAVLGASIFGLTALSGRPLRPFASPDTYPGASWGAVRIPLGTFLCAGGIVSLFFGQTIIGWYLTFWP